MSRFSVLKAELATAIKAAFGDDITIRFGQPLQPITGKSYVIVRTSVTREKEGRYVVETYALDIEAQFPLTTLGADTDIELFEQGDLLANQIAPHTEDPAQLSTIAKPTFGTRWTQPTVSAITPLDQVPQDLTRGVRIDAALTTTVFQ